MLLGDQQDAPGLWDDGYEGIWHLHDDFLDSTSNGTDGANDGTTDIPGQIADGQDFDGVDDSIALPGGCLLNDAWTLEFWFKPTVATNDNARMFHQGVTACPTRQLSVIWKLNLGAHV